MHEVLSNPLVVIALPIIAMIWGFSDSVPSSKYSDEHDVNMASGSATGLGILSATVFRTPELLPAFFAYAAGRRIAGLIRQHKSKKVINRIDK